MSPCSSRLRFVAPLLTILLAGLLPLMTPAKASGQTSYYASAYQVPRAMAAVPADPYAWNATPAVRVPSATERTFPFLLLFDGTYATAPTQSPYVVQRAVGAANQLQHKGYRMGGGHARVADSAYDCSGMVSYVLIQAGLLASPLPSEGFARYGSPGPGRFITLYVKPGQHVFMSICGLRLDTGWGTGSTTGPRWQPKSRPISGFILRHPPGF